MKPVGGLLAAALLVSAATATAQRESVRPATTPVTGQALLTDVQNSYDQMERNIEVQFAKLAQEAKNNKGALEDQIKELEKQIEHLKKMAKKIDFMNQKMQELLPKVMGPLGSRSGAGPVRTPAGGAGDAFAAALAAQIASVGITVSPAELQDLVSAIQTGGQAGMAVAIYICSAIAELGADAALAQRHPTLSFSSLAAAVAPARKNPNVSVGPAASAVLQSLLATLDFPKLTPGEIGVGASMSGAAASSTIAALLKTRAGERVSSVEQSVEKSNSAIKDARQKIKETEKLLQELPKKRDAAIAALRAQRAAAIARVPTPTPTPARMLKSP